MHSCGNTTKGTQTHHATGATAAATLQINIRNSKQPHLMHREPHCCRLHAQQLQSHSMHCHALRLAIEGCEQAHHLNIITLAQRVQRVGLQKQQQQTQQQRRLVSWACDHHTVFTSTRRDSTIELYKNLMWQPLL
jgi:hypothetical protein